MKNTLLPMSMLLSALVGCAGSTSDQVNADLDVSEDALVLNVFDITPGAGETIYTCDGYPLTTTGSFHMVISEVINAAGARWVYTSNAQNVKATDELGRSYVLTNSGVFTSIFNAQTSNSTSAFSFTLTGLGSAPNQRITGVFHQTFTPDGEPSATVDQFRAVCD